MTVRMKPDVVVTLLNVITRANLLADYQRAVFSTDISNCTPFSGYLSRKSSKGFWQKRWFYLNNQFLIYRKDEQATVSKGVLSLHEISAINATGNILEMVSGGRRGVTISCTRPCCFIVIWSFCRP